MLFAMESFTLRIDELFVGVVRNISVGEGRNRSFRSVLKGGNKKVLLTNRSYCDFEKTQKITAWTDLTKIKDLCDQLVGIFQYYTPDTTHSAFLFTHAATSSLCYPRAHAPPTRAYPPR